VAIVTLNRPKRLDDSDLLEKVMGGKSKKR
jgi:hypothetical protein